MKHKTLVFIFFCALFFNQKIISVEKTIPVNTSKVVSGNNQFAISLYKELPKSKNICFSPFSISSAFGMVYSGSEGKTFKEIEKVFFFPSNIDTMGDGWMWLNKYLTYNPSDSSDELRLNIANSLWIQTNFPVLSTFKDLMTKYFGGTFRIADFKNQPEAAVSQINAWVKQNTYGKIPEILNAGMVNTQTKMVIASALYFKAKWQSAFDERITSQQAFFDHNLNIKTVPTMTQTGYFPYYANSQVSVLEMPYQYSRSDGPSFSMIIVLPHERDGLSKIESEINESTFLEWINNLHRTRVIVSLPKFKITQTTDLKGVLTSMGMPISFNDNADFSGITGSKNLFIDKALHKVFLDVDEAGSEAAAITVITMQFKGSAPDMNYPILFQADHPFMYAIYEKNTGAILFMGRLETPE